MQQTQRNSNDDPFALHEGRIITWGNLWSDVRELAERLPDRPYLLNLCNNRYLFCISLLAAASRGQVCLLPPSNQMAVISEILQGYRGAYIACEHDLGLGDAERFTVARPHSTCLAQPPDFDWEQAALIAFTSGSTGQPKPCFHRLSTFRSSAGMAIDSLGLKGERLLLVSTTPPQHMYGLETSVFWPLFSKLVMHDGRPFYPEDIRRLVESAPWPAILASTPIHLRSLAQSIGPWPRLARVISATDTLPEKLAKATKAALGQSPYEIYGSTETLSFASREPLLGNLWRPYDNASLTQQANGQTCLESPHLPEPILLQDHFHIEADGRFTVLGRQSDLVKIGGKRNSLAELNRRLKDIEGVEDGFFYIQESGPNQGRLALVVVSSLDKQTIREGLRPYVDEVFLPRKIHYVPSLPRNALGKLAKTEMDELLKELGGKIEGPTM